MNKRIPKRTLKMIALPVIAIGVLLGVNVMNCKQESKLADSINKVITVSNNSASEAEVKRLHIGYQGEKIFGVNVKLDALEESSLGKLEDKISKYIEASIDEEKTLDEPTVDDWKLALDEIYNNLKLYSSSFDVGQVAVNLSVSSLQDSGFVFADLDNMSKLFLEAEVLEAIEYLKSKGYESAIFADSKIFLRNMVSPGKFDCVQMDTYYNYYPNSSAEKDIQIEEDVVKSLNVIECSSILDEWVTMRMDTVNEAPLLWADYVVSSKSKNRLELKKLSFLDNELEVQ